MTIDLTGPKAHTVHTCDHCGRPAELYRLIRTSVAICRTCFVRTHG